MMWRGTRRKGFRLEMVETRNRGAVIQNKSTDPEPKARSRLREDVARMAQTAVTGFARVTGAASRRSRAARRKVTA
jgi:hypothetical protein